MAKFLVQSTPVGGFGCAQRGTCFLADIGPCLPWQRCLLPAPLITRLVKVVITPADLTSPFPSTVDLACIRRRAILGFCTAQTSSVTDGQATDGITRPGEEGPGCSLPPIIYCLPLLSMARRRLWSSSTGRISYGGVGTLPLGTPFTTPCGGVRTAFTSRTTPYGVPM